MGLADIEDYFFVSKQVQVQALPIRRASLDEQETLERNDNLLIVHGMVLSRIVQIIRRVISRG
jgi:hypothetical protein